MKPTHDKAKSAGSATTNDDPTVTTFTVTMADGSSLRVYSACPECAGIVFSHEDVSEHVEEKRLLPCRHRAKLRAPVVF